MNTIQSRIDGETVGITLRMPRELRDEVKIQAIRAGRSFNTHVVMLLKGSIPSDAQRPQS